MDKILNGWFSELCPMWPGVSLSLEIEEVLVQKKSKYQQIAIYKTTSHGRMLVLDGIIQLTEADEFAYHEMLAHVPLFAHPDPQRVLVIGGGDGGILREVSRHDGIKTIDFCEIDPEVISLAKEFLPTTACGFNDSRVTIHIADGNDFIRQHNNKYDVIIVDSSDPLGPGKALFEKPFYLGLKKALKDNGIIATQGESFFLHKDCVTNLVKITRELFKVQAYAYMLVPTYPGGHLGICLGSIGPKITTPARPISDALQQQLKYYSPKIHEASFVLPRFAEEMFNAI